jgi:HJR/Mrr/RecB family endonuclease
MGYSVEVTGKTGDQGVGLITCRSEFKIAVQAKCYADTVGNSAVQKAYAGIAYYRCDRCIVIMSGDFMTGARELAQSTGCQLIGGHQLPALIRGDCGL